MSREDLVNLIIEKLRTGRVSFVEFVTGYVGVRFDYGSKRYIAVADGEYVNVFVREGFEIDNYSRWVEGVLNGKTRDECGVLS